MKTRQILGPLLMLQAMFFAACMPTVEEGRYLIEGQLKNVPDSTEIRLYRDEGNLFECVGQDTVLNGHFSFSDTISGAASRRMVLMVNGMGFPPSWLDVWVQSGSRSTVTGEDCLLPLWKVESDVAEQRAANEFKALCPVERKLRMQWMTQETDLFRRTRGNMAECRDLTDSLRALSDSVEDIIYITELQYMQTAPVTAVWLHQLASYSAFLQYKPEFEHIDRMTDLIRSLYTRLSEADKQTRDGRTITEYMNLPDTVGVGGDMADGDLYDTDGNLHRLSEFCGQYILLDFWSQGCGPCVQSLPEMEEITQMYKDKVAVVSISQDSEESWKQYVSHKRMKGNLWNELRNGNTGLAAAYQVNGIPHLLLTAKHFELNKN